VIDLKMYGENMKLNYLCCNLICSYCIDGTTHYQLHNNAVTY